MDMNFRTILLLLSTLLISSQFIMANEDKEEARPEVRLAAAKETLLESSKISLVYVVLKNKSSLQIDIASGLKVALGRF